MSSRPCNVSNVGVRAALAQRQTQIVGVTVDKVELAGAAIDLGEHPHVVCQRTRAVRIEAQRPRHHRHQPRSGPRIAAGEEGHMMTRADQLPRSGARPDARCRTSRTSRRRRAVRTCAMRHFRSPGCPSRRSAVIVIAVASWPHAGAKSGTTQTCEGETAAVEPSAVRSSLRGGWIYRRDRSPGPRWHQYVRH